MLLRGMHFPFRCSKSGPVFQFSVEKLGWTSSQTGPVSLFWRSACDLVMFSSSGVMFMNVSVLELCPQLALEEMGPFAVSVGHVELPGQCRDHQD